MYVIIHVQKIKKKKGLFVENTRYNFNYLMICYTKNVGFARVSVRYITLNNERYTNHLKRATNLSEKASNWKYKYVFPHVAPVLLFIISDTPVINRILLNSQLSNKVMKKGYENGTLKRYFWYLKTKTRRRP